MYGVSIDLFPLDAMPGDTLMEAKEYRDKMQNRFVKAAKKVIYFGVPQMGLTNFYKHQIKSAYYTVIGSRLMNYPL